MCKPSAPDTSRAEAEAARQRQAELEHAERRRQQELEIWQQQRADEERRYQEQLAAQQAENERQRQLQIAEWERQYQLQQQEIARQEQRYAEAEARAAAERAEEERQARLKAQQGRDYAAGRNQLLDQGVAAIDSAYAGFDDDYFSKFAQDFVSYYSPTLQREHKQQSDQTTFAYADAGTLRSSMAANAFGELERGRGEKMAELSAEAQDAAQGYRGDILNQKRSAQASIADALDTAQPVLGDGFDLNAELGNLGKATGRVIDSARGAASTAGRNIGSSNTNLSLANYAKRPGSRLAAAVAGAY